MDLLAISVAVILLKKQLIPTSIVLFLSGNLMTLTIACYSDLHGQLPDPVDCNLAIIAGDLCPEGSWQHQIGFLQGPFSEWLKKFEHSFFIAGNHDHVMETSPELVPQFPWRAKYLNERIFTPTHPMSGWMWPGNSFTVYGMPWSLPYGKFHFMCDEATIGRKLEGARSADLLIAHGPPYGLGDLAPRYTQNGEIDYWEHTGSKSLRKHIETYQPTLVVVGHLHESRGVYTCGKSTIINAAMAGFARDEYGRLRTYIEHPPIIVTLDDNRNVVDVQK